MASTNTLGSRRNEAQLHALAGVERELRSYDSTSRRKYVQDFSHAFQSYDSIIDSQQLNSMIDASDIVLIGDYHALPAAQRYAASLLEQRAHSGNRPLVLGMETIFARHQHILDGWWRREIDEHELRERIRFDTDWGYDWAPFYELLVTAREHADAIYGLDCMPREDLRKIGARDRHAVAKIAEIRERHPGAVIVVLFGESHFAPAHMPRLLRQRLPGERVLTLLQNVDALYWRATGERQDRVEAVRVSDNVACVFNSTPLEKYESYRLYLSRCLGDAGQPDLVPTIYNLIDSLLCFLGINRYSPHNTTQPKFLVDLLPEVYSSSSDGRLRQLLSRAQVEPQKILGMLQKVEACGTVYLPSINVIYVREFQMMYAAEEAARFLHHACRGLPWRKNGHNPPALDPGDRFYVRSVEHALAYFGSRVLYPARAAVRNPQGSTFSAKFCQRFMREALRGDRNQFDSFAQKLGYRLGSELYDAYLRGNVSRTTLRQLYLAHMEGPGEAWPVLAEILHKISYSRKKPCNSVRH
jgi:hypothetical protein